MQSSDAARGIAWMVLAGATYSMSAGIVRFLSDSLTTYEIVLWRCVTGFAILLAWAARGGLGRLGTRRLPLLSWRAAASYLGMLCSFYAYGQITMAEALALQFTLPLFTIMLAALLLGERVGAGGLVACLVGFAGALVVVRPGFAEVGLATVCALAAALFYAGANVAIRALTRTESTLVITFYGNLLVLPPALVLGVLHWSDPPWQSVAVAIGFGAINTLAQLCLARAIASADARVIQPFDFLRLPFGALLGYVAFGQVADAWTFVGAAIIFAGAYRVLVAETGPPRSTRSPP